MSHTLAKIYVHIVFSTRKREPFLQAENEPALFNYISEICKSLECWPVRIGGHKDHIHILCSLSRKISLLELVEEIKISSTRWVRLRINGLKNFSWQQGYAGFSVDQDSVPIVSHYIENQRQHHAGVTFEAELRKLLAENDIGVQDHFLWK
jgi:putative transposase